MSAEFVDNYFKMLLNSEGRGESENFMAENLVNKITEFNFYLKTIFNNIDSIKELNPLRRNPHRLKKDQESDGFLNDWERNISRINLIIELIIKENKIPRIVFKSHSKLRILKTKKNKIYLDDYALTVQCSDLILYSNLDLNDDDTIRTRHFNEEVIIDDGYIDDKHTDDYNYFLTFLRTKDNQNHLIYDPWITEEYDTDEYDVSK